LDEKRHFDLEALPSFFRGCVLTIGNFDGVHLGHQCILRIARALGDSIGAPVAAMTMDPPPDRVLHPGEQSLRLIPPEVKRALLLEAGADCVVTARVDAGFLAVTAEEFVDKVLVGKFAARHVVEGPNFFFGRGRRGSIELLRQVGPQKGFEVHVVEPASVEAAGAAERISSSLIRRRLILGDVECAHRCLGRPFALYGPVVRGEGRGRTWAIPTANLAPSEQVVPADGVYAGRARVEGRDYLAAISVGRKPTLAAAEGRQRPGQRTVEAFLLDAEGDFYDKPMALSFLHRLRSQERFEGIDQLRAQIAKDVQRVRQLLQ
jgi:riboflavin kinase/FMN adenylyltransferase